MVSEAFGLKMGSALPLASFKKIAYSAFYEVDFRDGGNKNTILEAA